MKDFFSVKFECITVGVLYTLDVNWKSDRQFKNIKVEEEWMQIKDAQINERSDYKRQWFISLDTELLILTDIKACSQISSQAKQNNRKRSDISNNKK